jgi:hypothetical protein
VPHPFRLFLRDLQRSFLLAAALVTSACSSVAVDAPFFDSPDGGGAPGDDGGGSPPAPGAGGGGGGGSPAGPGSGSGTDSGTAGGAGAGVSGGGSGSVGGSDGGAGATSSRDASTEAAASTAAGDAGGVRYGTTIAAILNGSCTNSCHGGAGGLTISYANIVNMASQEITNLNYVTPNDPGHSYLFCKMSPADPTCTSAGTTITGTSMPPGAMLSAGNLALIRTWIQQGALP